MRAGALKHKVTYQTSSEASDGLGTGGTVTWPDIFTTKAAIWTPKASEAIEAAKIQHRTHHRVIIRFDSRVTAAGRFKLGDRFLHIVSIRNIDERCKWLDVLTEEKG